MKDIYDQAFLKVYDEMLKAAMSRGFDDRALAFIMDAKRHEEQILRTVRSYPDGEAKAVERHPEWRAFLA